MIPVETIPGMGEEGDRMMEEVNSNMMYLIYVRTSVSATMYLHPTQKIPKFINKKNASCLLRKRKEKKASHICMYIYTNTM
jgi:hypothetical protein